jgi:adenylosuccinate synthase
MMQDPDSVIRVRDLLDRVRLPHRLRTTRERKLQQLRTELPILAADPVREEWQMFYDESFVDFLVDQYQLWAQHVRIVSGDYLATLMQQVELTVFEGAQGVLLDEWYGFQPYTTWSDTLDANARTLLHEADCVLPVTHLGVIRAYTTRHGPGPFVTEDPLLTATLPDYHNGNGKWQGLFRVGHLDLLAHRYAVTVTGGVDALAVTGLDRLAQLPEWKICDSYRFNGKTAAASRYVTFDAANRVTGINVPPYGDYGYGCELTNVLSSCEPLYQTVESVPGRVGATDARVGMLLDAIEGSLGATISITSFGPTAADKRALVAC